MMVGTNLESPLRMPLSLIESSTRVQIVADHREKRSGIPAHLASFPVVELHFDELAVGDYVVDNRVVFERKTTEDFARSIIDTRLFRQASMLARSCYRSAVIIEGDFETSRSGVSREAMQGALLSLALFSTFPSFVRPAVRKPLASSTEA